MLRGLRHPGILRHRRRADPWISILPLRRACATASPSVVVADGGGDVCFGPSVVIPRGESRPGHGHHHAWLSRSQALEWFPSLRPLPASPASSSIICEADPVLGSHLHWLAQKDALGQDVLLLGAAGDLRRELVLRYCEMVGRGVEHVVV